LTSMCAVRRRDLDARSRWSRGGWPRGHDVVGKR
jgi:hypothetical protein